MATVAGTSQNQTAFNWYDNHRIGDFPARKVDCQRLPRNQPSEISSSVDKSLAIVSGFSSPTAAPSQLVVMVIWCMDSPAMGTVTDSEFRFNQHAIRLWGFYLFWVTFHGDFKIVQAGPHAYFKRVRSQNMGESAREILRRASIGSSILMANATLHLKTAQTNLASPFSSTQFYHLGLFKRVIVCNFWVYHFLTNRKLDFGWFRASTRIFVTLKMASWRVPTVFCNAGGFRIPDTSDFS